MPSVLTADWCAFTGQRMQIEIPIPNPALTAEQKAQVLMRSAYQQSTIFCVPLKIINLAEPHHTMWINAMMDCGANFSLLTKTIAKKLRLPGIPYLLSCQGIAGSDNHNAYISKNLGLRAISPVEGLHPDATVAAPTDVVDVAVANVHTVPWPDL